MSITHEHDQVHAHGVHSAHEHEQSHEHDHDARLSRWARVKHRIQPHSHDAADSIDDALEGSREGIRAVKISLIALATTALAQGVLVVITSSVALLADTIHNFSDALTAVPLWIAFVLARRRPTRSYTYGYGRAEDLAGIFIVFMIALSAAVAGYQSISRLIEPRPIDYPWVLIAAGIIGFIGNEAVAIYRIRIGHRIGSMALIADGQHARTDGLTSLAVVGGAIGVLAGFPLADPIIGLIITAAILLVLRGVIRDVWRRLMDAVDPDLVDLARATLDAMPEIEEVQAIRLRWIGHTMRAEVDVTVSGQLTIEEGHTIAHQAEAQLRKHVSKLSAATVHIGPAPQERTVSPTSN